MNVPIIRFFLKVIIRLYPFEGSKSPFRFPKMDFEESRAVFPLQEVDLETSKCIFLSRESISSPRKAFTGLRKWISRGRNGFREYRELFPDSRRSVINEGKIVYIQGTADASGHVIAVFTG